MSEINAFLEACAKQKRLLGIPRMLWAFHKLYEVEDVNHPGAVEFRAACFASAENKVLQVDMLARNAVDAVRRAKYDPAMLFELAEAAGSWERFNEALRKNLPALRAAAAMSESKPIKTYPQPALLPRDKFIWENIMLMNERELKEELKIRKNFNLKKEITSGPGLKAAALRYSRFHKRPTRNFEGETPYSPGETG